MDRRDILKSAGAMTTAMASFARLGEASSNDVEIEVTLTGDETWRVDRDGYQRWKHTDEVHRDRDFLAKDDGIFGQWVKPRDRPTIEVEVEEGNKRAKDKIPEEADGVGIEVHEQPKGAAEQACELNDKEFADNYPGGAEIHVPDNDDAYGTIGPRLVSKDGGGPFFATSQHVVGVCNSDQTAESCYSPDAGYGEYIGSVEVTYNFEDFAVIRPEELSGTEDPKPEIYNPNGSDYKISGSFTKTAVASLEGDTAMKVGKRSCKTEGTVKAYGTREISESGCALEQKEQVRWATASEFLEGDSGSVLFAKGRGGDWNVISILNAYMPENLGDYSFGTAVYRIYNKAGFRYA